MQSVRVNFRKYEIDGIYIYNKIVETGLFNLKVFRNGKGDKMNEGILVRARFEYFIVVVVEQF